MRVTHRDIALHLGLDRSTVSRGIRNDPRLPLRTRKRIQVASKKLGYRPNPLLSELASSRWQSDQVGLGMTIAYIDCTSVEHPLGTHFSLPLPHEAARLGYRLEILRRRDFSSSAKLRRVLRNRGITDLILGPVYEASLAVQLDWSKFIAVQLLPGFFPLPLHSVVRDHFNGVVLAWRKAVERGYQRIGIVLFEHAVPVMDDLMRSSAVHACQTRLFPRLPILPLLAEGTVGAPYLKKFVAWVKTHKPEVIIGFSSGHYRMLRQGLSRDMPYINLNKDKGSELSGILENPKSCAREAVNLLHFCRRTYQWGVPHPRIDHVVEPTWSEGNSLPRKAAGRLALMR